MHIMDKKLIEKIVSEEINKLNEELSVSKEVADATDYILGLISDIYKEAREGDIRIRTMFTKENVSYTVHDVPVNLSVTVFGIKLNISLLILELQERSFMGDFINTFIPDGNFNERPRLLSIMSCCVKGETPCNQILRNMLQHELEHVFQFVKSGDYTDDNRYQMAVTILKNTSLDGVLMNIADLVYYLSNREIDANVNGLYSELTYLFNLFKNNAYNSRYELVSDVLHNSRYYKSKVEKEDELDDVINNVSSCDAGLLKWMLGKMEFKSISHLISYLKSQMDRMNEKELKVIQNAYNRHKLDEATLFLNRKPRNNNTIFL